MTEDCYSCEFVRTEDNIAQLRGSKYFQANIGDTFKNVKRDLLNGKKVLFSGTGCQINGLYLFLGKDYQNLFIASEDRADINAGFCCITYGILRYRSQTAVRRFIG